VVSHDRYFMDKVVDHLLVFKGDGVVKDFPGNYTQYREYMSLAPKSVERSPKAESKDKGQASRDVATPASGSTATTGKRKMTYKEKTEFERLEREIAALEEEQRQLEEALCSGTLSVEELTEKSRRLPQLKDELDEKSMRWLELSEI